MPEAYPSGVSLWTTLALRRGDVGDILSAVTSLLLKGSVTIPFSVTTELLTLMERWALCLSLLLGLIHSTGERRVSLW